MAEQYGYRDGGECLTVADKRELWFFEITGVGPEDMGALWVARRIPDDHVTVSANTPRISDVDFGDKDNYMYLFGGKETNSSNVLNQIWRGRINRLGF